MPAAVGGWFPVTVRTGVALKEALLPTVFRASCAQKNATPFRKCCDRFFMTKMTTASFGAVPFLAPALWCHCRLLDMVRCGTSQVQSTILPRRGETHTEISYQFVDAGQREGVQRTLVVAGQRFGPCAINRTTKIRRGQKAIPANPEKDALVSRTLASLVWGCALD